jgi:hypothetical protein
MHGEDRIDQIAPKGPEPSEDAVLVRASKPGVADDVGYQNRGQFPGLAHGANAEVVRSPGRGGLGMARFHAALEEGVEAGSASLRVGSRSLSTPRLSISLSTKEGIDDAASGWA